MERPVEPKNLVAARVVQHVDLYLRTERRIALLDLLVESGLRITLVGKGWKQWHGVSSVDYRGDLPLKETIQLMQQAKLTLDTPSLFQYGTHERVLTAMLAGSLVIAPYSPFYQDHFDDELILYNWDKRHTLPDQVRNLLENEPRRKELADAGCRKAQESHTYRARARNYLSSFCGETPSACTEKASKTLSSSPHAVLGGDPASAVAPPLYVLS